MLSKKEYGEYQSWQEKYGKEKVVLDINSVHKSWKDIFNVLHNDKRFSNRIEKELTENLEDENIIIHPKPDLVFNAFTLTKLKKLKVVILGQDPYFDHEIHDGIIISQAMGLSFSVPKDIKIPSSLKNIYKNLLNYNHIDKMPTHGNLEYWTKQGCLLLNTALTVIDGSNNKNCHKFIWSWFTDEIISYISDNKENVVFVLWGANALEKKTLIDETKHKIIISSHPSGLSAGKPMKEYPSFNENDCFGQINEYLDKFNIKKINWNIE